jgi:hypothetical protein
MKSPFNLSKVGGLGFVVDIINYGKRGQNVSTKTYACLQSVQSFLGQFFTSIIQPDQFTQAKVANLSQEEESFY